MPHRSGKRGESETLAHDSLLAPAVVKGLKIRPRPHLPAVSLAPSTPTVPLPIAAATAKATPLTQLQSHAHLLVVLGHDLVVFDHRCQPAVNQLVPFHRSAWSPTTACSGRARQPLR